MLQDLSSSCWCVESWQPQSTPTRRRKVSPFPTVLQILRKGFLLKEVISLEVMFKQHSHQVPAIPSSVQGRSEKRSAIAVCPTANTDGLLATIPRSKRRAQTSRGTASVAHRKSEQHHERKSVLEEVVCRGCRHLRLSKETEQAPQSRMQKTRVRKPRRSQQAK